MSAHTPGPWFISEQYRKLHGIDSVLVASRIENGAPGIARVFVAGLGSQFEANARLIAAAPELLEALETIITSTAPRRSLVRIARAAIAKARGGE